jgi:hypothetical protein
VLIRTASALVRTGGVTCYVVRHVAADVSAVLDVCDELVGVRDDQQFAVHVTQPAVPAGHSEHRMRMTL